MESKFTQPARDVDVYFRTKRIQRVFASKGRARFNAVTFLAEQFSAEVLGMHEVMKAVE